MEVQGVANQYSTLKVTITIGRGYARKTTQCRMSIPNAKQTVDLKVFVSTKSIEFNIHTNIVFNNKN